MRRRWILAFLFAPLFALAGESRAVPITVPTGLSPGDHYRLAFITSTTRDATSSNIADYNSFVDGVANGVAQLAALGTTWTAIGSTASVNARTNTSTDPSPPGSTGVPIFLLNDTKLVDNYDDLWDGSIDVAFEVDESGTVRTFTSVWSGTNGSGLVSIPLGNTTGGTNTGNPSQTFVAWIQSFTNLSVSSNRFYAISDVLTVPVPEPSTALLLAAGLAALAVHRRSG